MKDPQLRSMCDCIYLW